jgi:hypothetical protein
MSAFFRFVCHVFPPRTQLYHAYRKNASVGKATAENWWALQDLNQEPTDYESAALTVELRAQIVYLLNFEALS